MTTRDLLHNRAIVGLTIAEFISSIGSTMTLVALPWFVLHATGSPTRMTLVLAAQALPVALFGFASGRLAGRIGPRTTMLIGDVVRGPLIALVPLLQSLGVLPLPVMLAIVFVFGSFLPSYYSSQRVLVPQLVGEDERDVGQALGIMQVLSQSTLILGPPAAGVLIALTTPSTALYADGITYAVSAAILAATVPRRAATEVEVEPVRSLDGLRFLLRDRFLRSWTLGLVVLMMTSEALLATLPVLVVQRYADNPRVLGWLLGAYGVGAVVGGVGAIPLMRRTPLLLLVALGCTLQLAPWWVLPFPVPVPLLAGAFLVGGGLGGLTQAPMGAVEIARVPPQLRPTAFAATTTLGAFATPIGLFAVGPSIQAFGIRPLLIGLLAVMSAAIVWIVVAALREMAAQPAAASSSADVAIDGASSF